MKKINTNQIRHMLHQKKHPEYLKSPLKHLEYGVLKEKLTSLEHQENIEDTLKQLDIEHIMIENAVDSFNRLYRWHFLNHNSNSKLLVRDICDNCSDLLHSIMVKEAMKYNIQFVLFGRF